MTIAITINPMDIKTLAPMPVSLNKLTQMLANPEIKINDLARTIEFDEALTANVLRLANSALNSPVSRISSVKEAVVRLGTAQILRFAVGKQILHTLDKPFTGYELGEHELWRHSVASALAAENISKFTSQTVPPSAFTAALMHDIGKLILNRYMNSDAVREIKRIIESDQKTFSEAERMVFGTDHAILGGEIARKWQFPEDLINAIEFHHQPDINPNVLLDVVHTANTVAKVIGVGLGNEQLRLYTSVKAVERLGLTPSGFESLCARVQNDLANEEKLFSGN